MALWRIPSVKEELGHRSDASVYNAIRAGVMTSGVAIGERARAWPSEEIKAIAAARIAGYDDEKLRELVKRLHAKRAELATV